MYIKKILKKILFFFNIKLVSKNSFLIDGRQIKNILRMKYFFDISSNLEGNIVECGVGKGRTLFYLMTFLYDNSSHKFKKLWGFDSFRGFPSIDGAESSVRNPKKGEWGGTEVEDIKKIMLSGGIPEPYVDKKLMLVEGFFQDTLSKYNNEPIAFLHLDVDLYISYKITLEYFYPYVVSGGVIVFDEYGELNWPGATKAIDEFTELYNCELEYSVEFDKYYIIKKIIKLL